MTVEKRHRNVSANIGGETFQCPVQYSICRPSTCYYACGSVSHPRSSGNKSFRSAAHCCILYHPAPYTVQRQSDPASTSTARSEHQHVRNKWQGNSGSTMPRNCSFGIKHNITHIRVRSTPGGLVEYTALRGHLLATAKVMK